MICGGKSTRFGEDKCNIILEGKTLLQLALEKLNTICIEVLVAPKNPQKIDPQTKEKYKIIEDYPTAYGPIAAILSALKFAKYENLLVLGVDFPLVRLELLYFLLKTIEENVVKMVIPKINRLYQPLVAVYKKQLIPLLENWISVNHNYSLQNFIQRNIDCAFIIDTSNYKNLDQELFNLNTQNDFQTLKRLYKTQQTYGKN